MAQLLEKGKEEKMWQEEFYRSFEATLGVIIVLAVIVIAWAMLESLDPAQKARAFGRGLGRVLASWGQTVKKVPWEILATAAVTVSFIGGCSLVFLFGPPLVLLLRSFSLAAVAGVAATGAFAGLFLALYFAVEERKKGWREQLVSIVIAIIGSSWVTTAGAAALAYIGVIR